MNREILFRGKRRDNGEWVYGYYVKSVHTYGLLTSPTYRIEHQIWYDKENKQVYAEVYPETLGQFTGLLDKNGVKIFEGDILHIPYRYNVEVVSYKSWFCAVYKGAKGETIYNSITAFDDFEVIGNIYDNAELLEENDNGT